MDAGSELEGSMDTVTAIHTRRSIRDYENGPSHERYSLTLSGMRYRPR